jgi:N-acylneuraminate cytidylyltransferase
MTPNLLAVIPARGGSKGLPGKNTRELLGVPLIGYTIALAASLPSVSRAIVTTDDPEIAECARGLGGDVPFLRPADLARDDSPMAPVVQHALAFAESDSGTTYDGVLLLEPTCPVRTPERIEAATALFTQRTDLDGVVAVSEPEFNPLWVGVEALDDGTMTRFFPETAGLTRRQELNRRYLRINGAFYLWRRELVRRLGGSWLDEGRYAPFEIPDTEAFDIDVLADFDRLESLARAGLVQLPDVR